MKREVVVVVRQDFVGEWPDALKVESSDFMPSEVYEVATGMTAHQYLYLSSGGEAIRAGLAEIEGLERLLDVVEQRMTEAAERVRAAVRAQIPQLPAQEARYWTLINEQASIVDDLDLWSRQLTLTVAPDGARLV